MRMREGTLSLRVKRLAEPFILALIALSEGAESQGNFLVYFSLDPLNTCFCLLVGNLPKALSTLSSSYE